ncbi:hypothetical protein [Subtercola lobariae]|uniref:SbsA Ig-like domain-containing protein n=1 Tax=Subtercola lobariae TaxID=1588641 RepID=A0A917B734_9MICO|nr:hypothetical protein [Subtercola lobariae]GGF29080.1 hypothetical protein GCM10011399_22740 [Subtercola lobariae]
MASGSGVRGSGASGSAAREAVAPRSAEQDEAARDTVAGDTAARGSADVVAALSEATGGSAAIQAELVGGAVIVTVANLPDELALLPVDALPLLTEPNPVTTAGTWQRHPGGARFTPRFALVPGATYAIIGGGAEVPGGRFHAGPAVDSATPEPTVPGFAVPEHAAPTAGGAPWTILTRFTIPRPTPARETVALRIDPSCAEVPANLLRFSVTFSAEMADGEAARHIRLLDAHGRELPGALYDLPPELWDRSRHRLTLLLEPGRIKRGLQPNLQAGAPLVEGDRFTLVVDPELRDATGAELAAGAFRSYRVAAPLRSRVDPAEWAVTWPTADHPALTVRFGRALDRALVEWCLRVLGADGHPVPGRSSLATNAAEWMFVPAPPDAAAVALASAPTPADESAASTTAASTTADESADSAGAVASTSASPVAGASASPVAGASASTVAGAVPVARPDMSRPSHSDGWSLHVDARLEDLAGNSIRRVFDRDLDRPEDDSRDVSAVILSPGEPIMYLPTPTAEY